MSYELNCLKAHFYQGCVGHKYLIGTKWCGICVLWKGRQWCSCISPHFSGGFDLSQ